ncbi:unnamed protein product [Brassica napus]|uniref:(rape) hypothetical protein n=1 Tax=Brassica napus TaxID=3708 RepID=A0A816I4K3_BRANA|nr:unnamed protein product [Brassica napus]
MRHKLLVQYLNKGTIFFECMIMLESFSTRLWLCCLSISL